jgi:hypothetical protein
MGRNSAAVTLKFGYLAAMCWLYAARPALLAAALGLALLATAALSARAWQGRSGWHRSG